uniref:hypothetical protein n=1 Tax=Hericium alpestre TaxID=135208 RepID=UPI002434A004|nr:hypothetical protein QEO35_mgp37 [Hericium alpestre]WEX31996.1 hypothetical protein [Hericium alpestre]
MKQNYLLSDLICLYEVIDNFRKEIYSEEYINITKVLSISSLTFKIFKTNYLNKNKLPIIKGNHSISLRNAFYGGRVDVFKSIAKNIYIYDVTSLYPYVMVNYYYPTGSPTFSYDDNLNNYFGFCYVEVETPEYIHKPILPFKGSDDKIYYPIGKWTGMYFSEELKNAVNNYNYKVKILYGYKFEKSNNLFTEMINKYFELKKYAILNNLPAKAAVSKLLMNSLFGRFGMKLNKDIVNIVESSESRNIHLYHNVYDNFNLSDKYEYIKYSIDINELYSEINGVEKYLNLLVLNDNNKQEFETSLPIAMAVTAYARIYMSQFINSNDYTVYYTDTDSIAINKKLPDKYVGNELGKFKLEYHAESALFISPKLYYLRLFNGEEIIKARTLGGDQLTENDFIELSYGLTITKLKSKFITNKENLNIFYENTPLKLSPWLLKRNHFLNDKGQFDTTTPLKVINNNIETIYPPKIITSLISYNNI